MRSVRNALREVKTRKPSWDLEAEITRLTTVDVGPDGTVYPPRYRHRAAAKRHLLMDKQQKANRRTFHRAVRHATKLELRTNQ